MVELKQLSVTELKALAYDQLALLEQTQNNIRVINTELLSRNNAQQEEEKAADWTSKDQYKN